MPYDLVIKNARLVNEGTIIEGDLAIESGRIVQIGGSLSAANELDAVGSWLVPGMIDDQVHFREPGFEHKGSIETESRAAIAGGVTSYMEMPNCNPQTTNAEALQHKYDRAAKHSFANYGFYLGATNDNLEDIKSIDPSSACGIKVFMGASTGNMLVDDPDTLNGIFSSAPILIATHCENTPMILANEARAREQFGNDVPFIEHANIRSAEVCYASSSFAVELAHTHGARLHILHLTTAREMELFNPGPIETKRITAEACVHHLFCNDSWYATRGADIKCNPAIKRSEDQEALLAAVVEDRIDVIATDHAPHTVEEKAQSYFDAPAGLPLVQHALLTLIEHVKNGVMSIEKVVQKTAHAPAQLFDVSRRGYLREGYWADLVIIDPDRETVVNDEPIYAKCGWSPFNGLTFRSRITHTLVNGKLVYEDGELIGDSPAMALVYER
ncbi:MAG: dihydroorotase [Pseudomonadales bacterium]|nr:dihydroorotase [Pseudomonadales bacterium]